jgi:hypothetical protein
MLSDILLRIKGILSATKPTPEFKQEENPQLAIIPVTNFVPVITSANLKKLIQEIQDAVGNQVNVDTKLQTKAYRELNEIFKRNLHPVQCYILKKIIEEGSSRYTGCRRINIIWDLQNVLQKDYTQFIANGQTDEQIDGQVKIEETGSDQSQYN